MFITFENWTPTSRYVDVCEGCKKAESWFENIYLLKCYREGDLKNESLVTLFWYHGTKEA